VRRAPRDELADATPLGGVYLRRLVRAQLTLSVLALAAFGGILGVLPIALYLLPSLSETELFGVPLALLILVFPPFPLLVAIGWLYTRRANALDRSFRELAADE
jgi:hypothetical protein